MISTPALSGMGFVDPGTWSAGDLGSEKRRGRWPRQRGRAQPWWSQAVRSRAEDPILFLDGCRNRQRKTPTEPLKRYVALH